MVKLYFMVSNPIWNYYYDGLKIGNNSYNFEFEVVSMSNGENHYRVQKLEKINNKKADNIPQSNNNVKSSILPTINNMQNIKLHLNFKYHKLTEY